MDAKTMLLDKNIRPSVTRLKIMEYLLSVRTHPTVEDIYEFLTYADHTRGNMASAKFVA